MWALCILCLNVSARSIYTIGHVKGQIKVQMTDRLIEQFPHVITSSISIEFVNRNAISKLPRSFARFKFDIRPDIRPLGRTIIPLQVYDDQDMLMDDRQIVVKVRAKSHYIRAKRHLNKGEIISLEDISMQAMDMHGKPYNSKRKLEDVIDKQVATFVSSGTILTDYMVKPQPLVRKDDWVEAIYSSGGVELSFKVRVLEDGAFKEMVRVESTVGDQNILQGKVINEKTVYINR